MDRESFLNPCYCAVLFQSDSHSFCSCVRADNLNREAFTVSLIDIIPDVRK